jgi:4-oxalocrotonate tautomerase
MPYVNIRITREGATADQKEELIRGVTDLLVRVLNKDPKTTFVIIDEIETDNWGVDGMSITNIRKRQKQG